MYEERKYRQSMGTDRFRSFSVSYFETDLWIGVDRSSYCLDMEEFVLKEIRSLRKELDDYIHKDKAFAGSLSPIKNSADMPQIAKDMTEAAGRAGIGPLGAVAGAFSQYIGRSVAEKFNVKEIAVENGGDIYLKIQDEINIFVYAGDSPLSQKVGICVPKEYSPLGICTSAGRVGHSFSYGNADAVMVACKDTLLADAYATALGNMIKKESDIDKVLEKANSIKEILAIVIICNDKMGIRGEFQLEVIN